ncbi:MAG TPA: DegQ family serine endoprotease [Rhizobiaceae bacterium]|nr:DegQ family serine endoprotease [Rhizobiaceae bacterium]
MKFRRLAPILTLAIGLALPAAAEDSKTISSDILNELLRGSSDAAPLDRKVPFGRAEMELSFAPLVKATAPAVVNVYASSTQNVQSPFMGDPFFEQFFGRQVMPPRVQSSLGSGVLVDATGIVVTNYHVIRGADEVKVATADGREFESTVTLKDEQLDLAILKITSNEQFPTIPVGDSEALEIGDLVLAIGNPFGVGQTTTSGIVSALARSHIGIGDFGYFIQTDAAINPGNSGGALINMRGELVGINSAIYSQSGGSIGIGFAIPSNIVRAFVASAQAGNDFFERPYIGASFDDVTAQIAESLGMSRPSGALVSRIEEGGPAAKGGLKPGDVLLAMDGAAIDSVDGLGYRLAVQQVGHVAKFNVLRKGAETPIEVTLEKVPAGANSTEVEIGGRSPFAGAKVAEVSPRLAQRLNLRSGIRGVAVVDINPNSPAAGFGFRPRDVLLEVNGEEVTTAEQLQQIAQSRTRTWRFTIERDGRVMRQILRF